MKVFPINKTFEYVLLEERDLPKEEQTIWEFKTPTMADYCEIGATMMLASKDVPRPQKPLDEMSQEEQLAHLSNISFALKESREYLAARSNMVLNALVAIKNLKDGDGNVVDAKTREQKEGVLFQAGKYLDELFNAVSDNFRVSGQEAKNSD